MQNFINNFLDTKNKNHKFGGLATEVLNRYVSTLMLRFKSVKYVSALTLRFKSVCIGFDFALRFRNLFFVDIASSLGFELISVFDFELEYADMVSFDLKI
ncbi:hypothetical protein RIR_jg15874.t1 [Rhizophagus irregularis DAOM 181602=DAOM 197198]|nr:hypothetical protein RIR_jg15874.t1 [Rhizophagus irregularis DAOM 181602=DAOM 197198]